MKRYGMVILMGLVLGTNVQAQTTLRTNTTFDETWNNVIDQLIDTGAEFTTDKESGIIRSKSTVRMKYGESTASCSLTPKYLIPVNSSEPYAQRATFGDSTALASVMNNTNGVRMSFETDEWAMKYNGKLLGRSLFGVDFTTDTIPHVDRLPYGNRGKMSTNPYYAKTVNYDWTIVVRSVEGGSTVRVSEKYSGEVIDWQGTTLRQLVLVFQDFAVYSWKCDGGRNTLGISVN
jgi:hypothetical protein